MVGGELNNVKEPQNTRTDTGSGEGGEQHSSDPGLPSCCRPSPISPKACRTIRGRKKKTTQNKGITKKKQLRGILHISRHTAVKHTNTSSRSSESSKPVFPHKQACVTNLSALNDELTDTAHEHVFTLAVFLLAAEITEGDIRNNRTTGGPLLTLRIRCDALTSSSCSAQPQPQKYTP